MILLDQSPAKADPHTFEQYKDMVIRVPLVLLQDISVLPEDERVLAAGRAFVDMLRK
jgi:hypothetical protein